MEPARPRPNTRPAPPSIPPLSLSPSLSNATAPRRASAAAGPAADERAQGVAVDGAVGGRGPLYPELMSSPPNAKLLQVRAHPFSSLRPPIYAGARAGWGHPLHQMQPRPLVHLARQPASLLVPSYHRP